MEGRNEDISRGKIECKRWKRKATTRVILAIIIVCTFLIVLIREAQTGSFLPLSKTLTTIKTETSTTVDGSFSSSTNNGPENSADVLVVRRQHDALLNNSNDGTLDRNFSTSLPLHENNNLRQSNISETLSTLEEDGLDYCSQSLPEQQPCFKTVTNTGGFGNRIGPLMCALGLSQTIYIAQQQQRRRPCLNKKSPLLWVLWNAANEGTPSFSTLNEESKSEFVPRPVRTGRGGYDVETIQALVDLPFTFVPSMEPLESSNIPNVSLDFYADSMLGDVQRWKSYMGRKRRTHIIARRYHAQEIFLQTNISHCKTVPTNQPLDRDINDYTPEACWTRYEIMGQKYPQLFGYLKEYQFVDEQNKNDETEQHNSTIITKQNFVKTLIQQTRQIQPKNVSIWCLPPPKQYIVLHARRGDRSNSGAVSNLLERLVEPMQLQASKSNNNASFIPIVILSENEEVQQNLTRQAQQNNLTTWNRTCGIQDVHQHALQQLQQSTTLIGEIPRLHDATLQVLQDYFTMTHAAGIMVDYERDQSSFSTTAALGFGIPMLYPGPQRRHYMNHAAIKTGNSNRPLLNVYFWDTVENYFQAVDDRNRLAQDY